MLAGKQKKFDLINQDLLLVIDHGITTRRVGAAKATRCSHSSAVQLQGRPYVRPLHAVRPWAPDAATLRYPHVQGGSIAPPDC